MQTICFTTTARVRRPAPKVVDFSEYRKLALSESLPSQPEVEEAAVGENKPGLRSKMQFACLLLELSVCASVLVLTIIAISRLVAA